MKTIEVELKELKESNSNMKIVYDQFQQDHARLNVTAEEEKGAAAFKTFLPSH